MLRASVRFLDRALLIGIMELRTGIKIPITRAVMVDFKVGIIEGPI